MSNKINLTKDPIWDLLRKVTIPASVGSLFQTFYNLVDTWFAGRISAEAIGAIAKSFPIYFMIIATSIGVTVAGTSLIGSCIGEKNEKNVLTYFANVIIYAMIISIAALWILSELGDKWWLWLWIFLSVLALVGVALAPVLKQLFNKYTPIKDKNLKKSIEKYETYSLY